MNELKKEDFDSIQEVLLSALNDGKKIQIEYNKKSGAIYIGEVAVRKLMKGGEKWIN